MGCYPSVTLMADGLVDPYETTLQIDSDQEEAGAPMGLVTTSRPVGSVGTFSSGDSGKHSFAEQWEDGSFWPRPKRI